MASVQTFRIFWAAAGLGAGLFWAPAKAEEGADALWSAMARCAAMTDAAMRHDCADDALISVGLLTNADLAAQRIETFGLPETAKAARREAEKAPPAAVAEAAPAVEEAADAPQPPVSEDEITLTIAAVGIGRGKRAVLTTEEGAVWRQTDGGALRPAPKPGQAMTVERTSFGGYRCKIRKWSAFRCERDA
jgi:hypothetical protein